MCLAQEYNTVTPVKLEPTTPLSRVKHSTTEPLCSLSAKWSSWSATLSIYYVMKITQKSSFEYFQVKTHVQTACESPDLNICQWVKTAIQIGIMQE